MLAAKEAMRRTLKCPSVSLPSHLTSAIAPSALDRSQFRKQVPIIAAQIPELMIHTFLQEYRDETILIPRYRKVITESDGSKFVCLGPIEYTQSQWPQKLANFIKSNQIQTKEMSIELDYSYWSAEEILVAILPDIDDALPLEKRPSGYTMAGHIAHVNLRENWLPHRYIIGQVIIDKCPGIKTVVNKLDSIETKFRTFEMEVIAGKPDFLVTHHEANCEFVFDFSKVYWNSRLETEHKRLCSLFQPGQLICDVTAGVGPFSCPAGKKKIFSLANDLNPASFEALKFNIVHNKVQDFVRAYNYDGDLFIRKSYQLLDDWLNERPSVTLKQPRKRQKLKEMGKQDKSSYFLPKYISHYILNLPASGYKFLGAFRNLYNTVLETRSANTTKDSIPMPWIHLYIFSSEFDKKVKEELRSRIAEELKYDIQLDKILIHEVRKVSPKKKFFCCSFVLPKAVAFNQ